MHEALAPIGDQVGWDSHHVFSAAVHSFARRKSKIDWNSRIAAQ